MSFRGKLGDIKTAFIKLVVMLLSLVVMLLSNMKKKYSLLLLNIKKLYGYLKNLYGYLKNRTYDQHKFLTIACIVLILILYLVLSGWFSARNPKEISFVGEFTDMRLNMSDAYFEISSNKTDITGKGIELSSADRVDWYGLQCGKSPSGYAHLQGNHLEFEPVRSDVVLLVRENKASVMTIASSPSANKYDVTFEIESPSNRTRIKLVNTSQNLDDCVEAFYIHLNDATGYIENGEKIPLDPDEGVLSGTSEGRVFFNLGADYLFFTVNDAFVGKDKSQTPVDLEANRKTNITSIDANVSRGVLSIGKDYKPLPAAYGIKIQAVSSGDLDYRILPSKEIQIYGIANSLIVGGDELIPSNFDKIIQLLLDNIGGIFGIVGVVIGVFLADWLQKRNKNTRNDELK